MSIIDTLITDRTAADTAALEALFAKAKAGTITDEEWAVLNDPTHKGAYNYTDLNRVSAALEYLREQLEVYGYSPKGYVKETRVWQTNDIPSPAQMAQYLANVAAIRQTLAVRPNTPAMPGDIEDLSAEEANAIEMILVDVETLLTNMPHAFPHAGVTVCGIQGGLIA